MNIQQIKALGLFFSTCVLFSCQSVRITPEEIQWEKVNSVCLETGDENYGVEITGDNPVTHIMRDSDSGIPLFNNPNGNLDKEELAQLDILLKDFLRVAPPAYINEDNPFDRVSEKRISIGIWKNKERIIYWQYDASSDATQSAYQKIWDFLKNQQ